MTTNLQMGLAYVLGLVGSIEHKLINVGEVISNDDYKAYTVTMHSTLHGDHCYVLYKDLGKDNSIKLAEIYEGFKLNQKIHILEQAICYDLKS